MICQRDIVRMPAHIFLLAGIPAQLQLPMALCAPGMDRPLCQKPTAGFLEHLSSEGILGPWETAVCFSLLIAFPSVFGRYLGC